MSTTARPPSSWTLERAMSAAMSLRKSLVAEDGSYADDDRLLLDMIEGQTDVFELLDRVVEASMADAVLAELAAARARRLKARQDHLRQTALQILEALEITAPIERPSYTASISRRAKAIVTDEALLPPSLFRRAPDMHAIHKALKEAPVSGATMGNPVPFLTIRTR